MTTQEINLSLYEVVGNKYGADGTHPWTNLPSAIKDAVRADPSADSWATIGGTASRVGSLSRRGLIPAPPTLSGATKAELSACGGIRVPVESGAVCDRLAGTIRERIDTLAADGWSRAEIATALRTSNLDYEAVWRSVVDAGWSRSEFGELGPYNRRMGEFYDGLIAAANA